MKLETMYFEREGRIGYLTLNRPNLLNAMNYQGALDMNQAAEMIRDDPETRILVIRGAGRAFCTGIDLKQLQAGGIPHDYAVSDCFRRGPLDRILERRVWSGGEVSSPTAG